ncbi:MAG TPA: hypothetical protein VD966_10195 [Pyrinomonadaceae bacterium]|nr:hypothetical protein [Pyrinomonadaceae bacterium]
MGINGESHPDSNGGFTDDTPLAASICPSNSTRSTRTTENKSLVPSRYSYSGLVVA